MPHKIYVFFVFLILNALATLLDVDTQEREETILTFNFLASKIFLGSFVLWLTSFCSGVFFEFKGTMVCLLGCLLALIFCTRFGYVGNSDSDFRLIRRFNHAYCIVRLLFLQLCFREPTLPVQPNCVLPSICVNFPRNF